VPRRDYNGPNTIGKSWENHRKIGDSMGFIAYYGPILPLPGINGVIISETKVNNITQMNSNDFFEPITAVEGCKCNH
jgi:hypothetical protein